MSSPDVCVTSARRSARPIRSIGDAKAAQAAGYAATPVPPTYLFCLEMMDAEQAFEFITVIGVDIGRLLHGEQRFTYRAPVVVGDTLMFQPRIVSVADKKGGAMTLVGIETKVTNQNGTHVADCRPHRGRAQSQSRMSTP